MSTELLKQRALLHVKRLLEEIDLFKHYSGLSDYLKDNTTEKNLVEGVLNESERLLLPEKKRLNEVKEWLNILIQDE